MEPLTLLQCIEWEQDPIQTCADSPVILASNFESLSQEVSNYPEVTLTAEEVLEVLKEQSKRFSACGANNSERFAVIRKNPETGWQYIIDLITK